MPEAREAEVGAQVDALMGKLSMTSAQHTQVGLTAGSPTVGTFVGSQSPAC